MKSRTVISYAPAELDGMKSGKYGNFLIMEMESKSEGWRRPATALEIKTANKTGIMYVISPVISEMMTTIETARVTPPGRSTTNKIDEM